MLEVKHLTVCSKEGKPLVRDVSFTLIPGEPLGLTGASGSGKTTIIKAIMGILPYGCDVKAGEILLDGQSLEGLPARKRREYCGTVLGFIPQSPMTAFDPHMKIGAQMMQTFRIRLNLSKDKALTLAREQLLAVNLEDVERILNAFPSQLSGGMLQRVSMACLADSLHAISLRMNLPQLWMQRTVIICSRCCKRPTILRYPIRITRCICFENALQGYRDFRARHYN